MRSHWAQALEPNWLLNPSLLVANEVASPLSLLSAKGTSIGTARASQVALVIENPPANAGDIRDTGSNPGLGRYPGEGHGNPLQYSCLEKPMDRGAWQPTVCGVTKSQTQLK